MLLYKASHSRIASRHILFTQFLKLVCGCFSDIQCLQIVWAEVLKIFNIRYLQASKFVPFMKIFISEVFVHCFIQLLRKICLVKILEQFFWYPYRPIGTKTCLDVALYSKRKRKYSELTTTDHFHKLIKPPINVFDIVLSVIYY